MKGTEINSSNIKLKNTVRIAAVIAMFCGLYVSSQHNYLLFHGIVEVFSIVIACAIFMFAHIYREEGRSAHVEDIHHRPVFRQIMDDAARHQFDVVVVHTLDRWSRNLKVTLESLSLLGKQGVGLVSIAENIDYSRPEGMLFTQMLGAFAQYYSEALGTHVRKGLEQRATEGKHTGFIPFGYESCWEKGLKGERMQHCDPEHPGGVHIHPKEGPAVSELFKRYASSTTTLANLAAWLNDQGFRTHNTKRLPDASGNLVSGPRLFTRASVRNILHNPFYTGKVKYRDNLLPGAHELIVGQDVFNTVQVTLKKNSGRSETLISRPQREYLLKGIVRCAYCGMPMWAQTYNSGKRYYREHKASRSIAECPAHGGAILCRIIDEQVNHLVSAIELSPRWLEEVLSIISLKDEIDHINKRREVITLKLHRMARVYVDGLIHQDAYTRQKKLLELELESLVIPDYNAAEEAGNLIMNLPALWDSATLSERRELLVTMLDAVYVDAKQSRSIIAVKPKPPFRPILQVAASRKGSNIRILKEPLDCSSNGSSVFLVETGESRTPPRTRVLEFVGC